MTRPFRLLQIVTVRRMDGNKVWLNVSAPKSVPVLRVELLSAKGDMT